jgi:hypothetical protein
MMMSDLLSWHTGRAIGRIAIPPGSEQTGPGFFSIRVAGGPELRFPWD